MNRMTLRHDLTGVNLTGVGNITGGFKVGNLADSTLVSLVPGKHTRDERFDEEHRLVNRVLASSDRTNIGVIVLPGQHGRLPVPHQSRPNPRNFIGRNLLTITGTTKHHTQCLNARCLVGNDRLRGTNTELGIVVESIKTFRPVVNNFVTGLGQEIVNVSEEFEAGMVGGKVDSHDASVNVRSQLGLPPARSGFLPYRRGTPMRGGFDVAVPEFRRSVRGFDTEEVSRYLRDIDDRLERLESDRAESARTIQRLNRELQDANERASRGKPSFAELGSAFEETLRLAEAQSQKIIQEAAAEATEVLGNARSESTQMRESAAKESRQTLQEAQRAAEELRLDSEREAAQLRQQAADEIAKATNTRTRAERAAATMISQAEKQVAEIKADASRQVEQIKREASELLHAAQERAVATDASIRQQIDEAERARAAIHEEADQYAQKAYQQADEHVQNAAKRAADLGREADIVLQNSQQRAEELTRDARAYAQRLVSETVSRTRAIARETEDLVNTMVSDAESHMSDLRRQQTMLEDYVHRMRRAASEVDMEIESTPPPSLEDKSPKPVLSDDAEEEMLDAVEVTVDAERSS